MKSYPIVSFISMLSGWLGGILFHGLVSILLYDSVSGGDTGVVAFWSFWFVLLAYGLFIMLPEQFMLRMFWRCNHWQFLIFTSFYGLLSFTLLIGWLFFLGDTFQLVFADAMVMGLIYGLVFWELGNKKSTQHSPFDL